MVEFLKYYSTLRQANIYRQLEWDPGAEINALYRATEMAGECGEACNEVKKLVREQMGIKGSRTTKQRLAHELADVVICADLLAMSFGIDLQKAIQEKFNATSEKVGLLTRLRLSE